MRLNSLHNALYAAAKLLRADLVAVKLLPNRYVDWAPADIAVGETSRLQQFSWVDGNNEPEPRNCLRRHQPLFGVEDALSVYAKPDTQSLAISIRVNDTLLDAMPGQFLLHERRGNTKLELGIIWLAIALEEHAPSIDALLNPDGTSELVELVLGVCSQAIWGMYRSAMLSQDSTTALPGSAELRHKLQLSLATLKTASERNDPQESNRTLLMLLEIDNFSLLRRQLGSAQTEQLLQEVTRSLRQAVRKNDGLFRFSDSIFALTADVADGAAIQVIDKVTAAWRALAEQDQFIGITSSIGFSIAGRHTDKTRSLADLPSAQQLLLGTEQALYVARAAGGNQAIEAGAEHLTDAPGENSLSENRKAAGVFTSDPMKDYRNNRILWQTTRIIAGETNPEILCQSFVGLLEDMLRLHQADIFVSESGRLESQVKRSKYPRSNERSSRFDHSALVQSCLSQQTIQQTVRQTGDKTPEAGEQGARETNSRTTVTTVPLLSRTEAIGVLLVETDDAFDDSDLLFVQAIADQIAGALDRIELAARQSLLNARERESLRAEIQELRETASGSKETSDQFPVVAASQSMRDVLAYVAKVAPTDASVLIMGESGAGKEVMAKAIVAASNRAHAPLVTVDCSAIAHSLIDSELFGRVKGAFTGADDASPGRIAQADGGTLFLDEIGELPMDVQAKLLRFVQEKELIAVGDTRRRRIDARIICATNRDLRLESSQGRFRSDLYYRLQVLQVTVPPLRERRADIAALAESFAKRYSEQFGKSVSGFTEQAWQKINSYLWPGNVRELQNAIVRATLTTETHLIDAGDLQFGEELPAPEQSVFTSETPAYRESRNNAPYSAVDVPFQQNVQPPFPEAPQGHSEHTNPPDLDQTAQIQNTDDWSTLKSLLAGQVAALVAESRLEAPVGRWLADTVVLTAAAVSNGVARQAARILGVPETTLRRQLNKARQNEDNPFQLMSNQWLTSLPALTDLLQTLMTQAVDEREEHIEFAEHCQILLLQQVANQIGDDRKAGAALMGITPPTYARWLERHSIEPQPLATAASTTKFKLEQKYS